MSEMPTSPLVDHAQLVFDDQLRNTILAALYHYAATGQGDPACRTDVVHALATDGDRQISMDATGIAYAFRCVAEAMTVSARYAGDACPPVPAWTAAPAPVWGPKLEEARADALGAVHEEAVAGDPGTADRPRA